MSLLMDALKKAEQAKLEGQANPDAAKDAADLTLDPTPVSGSQKAEDATRPTVTLPELHRLEDLDAEFIAHARPRESPRQPVSPPAAPTSPASTAARPTPSRLSLEPTAPAADTAAEKKAIRNAFAVKDSHRNGNTMALVGAVVGMLAIGLVGVYLWLQMKPTPGAAPQVSGSRMTTPAAPTAARADGRTEQPRPPIATAPTVIPLPPPRYSVPPSRPPMESRRAERSQPAVVAGGTQFRVTSGQVHVDPVAVEGYEALKSDNLAAARSAYERQLRADPRNVEALHGIAIVALRESKDSEAEAAYLRILEANPGDAAAQAGLVGLNAQEDPVAGESRMKSLLAAQGDTPVLNFALGNLYARQNRWNEAQQAYFKAVAGESGNPDYLFNLAISLDQLHQPKLAAQYYGQALAAAEKAVPAFDRAQATKRLHELQR